MRKRHFAAAFLVLAAFVALPLSSATVYDNGSQRFTITAGPEFPISISLFDEGGRNYVGMGDGDAKTKLSLGGYGSIAYQIFMNRYVAIGGEIGYAFNYVVNDNLLTNVPIQFKLSVIPLQGRFEIPLSFGIGFSYLSLSSGSATLPLFASFETGFDFYFNDNWGVGIHSGIWVVGEFYLQKVKWSQNAISTFVPVTLAVTYRQ